MFKWKDASQQELRQLDAICLILRNHSELLRFMFEENRPRLRCEPEDLLKESGAFSRGERLLIQVGMDVWSGAGNANLYDLIHCLDESNYRNVLLGLGYFKETEIDGGGFLSAN